MSRIYAYEREPYRRQLEVEVIAAGEGDGRPFVILDDTILYPEGGGQPADHGFLRPENPNPVARLPDKESVLEDSDGLRTGTPVIDVRRAGDQIRHWLAAPVAVGPATVTLDWCRRFDHMQQHTAQHLLTAIAADRYGWQTTSFHLSDDLCDVELDVRVPAQEELANLEEAVNAQVRAGRPVLTRRVEPGEVEALGVRSRGLPAGHRGSVRLVEISEVDLNTCGGTHLASTAEIECLKLLGAEPRRGGCLLRWIAGGRVRQRLAGWEQRGAELRRVLDAGDDQLTEIAALKLAQLKQGVRRQRALEGRLAEAVAAELAARSGAVVDADFDDADMGFLQQIARRFAASAHPGVALLTASNDQGSFFVVAAGSECDRDVKAAGGRVAGALGGRGGGSGSLFQGKAPSLASRAAALAALAGC